MAISGSSKLIECSGRTIILLPKRIQIFIDDTLFYTKSQRYILSFKDIRLNGYHIETMNKKTIKYLYITIVKCGKKCLLERLFSISSGLNYTHISATETHAISNIL
ncbi:hypothetical protein ES319_D03G131800v1 [Gossypium barbadense]|uniref:Uncharacterized protein n=1 Tax=Gossypium barbadense TaxID=3634 RepID=A0A5J5S3V3_GOSBA|nr:hypothetical protein ES319_D03G131800v1 [Gossypium barbadense]